MTAAILLAAFVIHVNPGTGLGEALGKVRELSEAQRAKGVEVVFAPGRYTASSLTFEAGDSGSMTGRILWRAEEPGTVIFAQATEIPQSLIRRLDSGIYEADLAKFGFHYGSPLKKEADLPISLPEVYVDGTRMVPAEWPNGGWSTIEEILDKGSQKGTGNAFDTLLGTKPEGADEAPRGGSFKVKTNRLASWAGEKEVLLHGFWCFDWRDTVNVVEALNPTSQVIKLKFPHVYGLRQGNPNPRRWRALHVRAELDAPGEFYIDRDEKKLYFIPPAGYGPKSIVSVADCSKPTFITCNGLSNVVFRGIRFEECFVNAVDLNGCNRVAFAKCEFRNIRHKAIDMTDCTKCVVRSTLVEKTGNGGIRMHGGDRKTLTPASNRVENCRFRFCSMQRLVNSPAVGVLGVGNIIRHCEFTDAPGSAVVYGECNDAIFEYNVISNCCTASDDAGAFYKGRNPSSRGNVFRYNLWQDIGSPKGHGTAAIYFDDGSSGDTVFGNVFENCGKTGKAYGSFGAVFSHGGCSNICRNCIFIRCDRSLGSGPWTQERWEKPFKGGLPIRNQNYDFKFEAVDYRSPVWKARYPELETFLDPYPDEIRWNAAYDNAFVDCPATLTYNGGKQKVPGYVKGRWFTNETDVVISGDPGFVDASRRDYRLRDDSQIYRKIPNFKPIPFGKIGLLTPEGER
mgnify:CR=1 FL=1